MVFLTFNMERFSSARDTKRHSNDNRCLLDSVGRLDTRSRGAGVLGQGNVLPSFQLQRTIGRVARSDFLTRIPTNKTVQICSDNITTVAFINHMECSTKELDTVGRQIHQQAINMYTKIVVSYISGVKNWQADQLSRLKSTYELKHPNLFRRIDSYWGPHNIDRFASMMITQIPNYNSLYWDPLTSGVNALDQEDWSLFNNYVNAPFSLLPKVLAIIEQQQATATIIAPIWPAQIWFQRMRALLIDSPIPLPSSPRTVLRIGPRAEPLKTKGRHLYAWRVSGRRNSDA